MSNAIAQQKVVLAGGSGFIGVSLARRLAERGASVVILSRTAPRIDGPWRHVPWDGRTIGQWRHELDGAAGLVNLAGRSVNCIKTPDHRDEILWSRVEATCALGEAMRCVESPPPVWVQMSTAHIFGDPPRLRCTEDSALGYGLAPFVGRKWEEAFCAATLPSQRQVVLRTSFVLGRNLGVGGGALDALAWLARLGLGGKVGGGEQGMSWIHETDMNRFFERALTHPEMRGVYVASSPFPVSQAEFMRELRRAIGMPLGLPAPEWLVRIGAHMLLRSDPELVLYGRYVVPRRLEQEGFAFEYPRLKDALQDLLGKAARQAA